MSGSYVGHCWDIVLGYGVVSRGKNLLTFRRVHVNLSSTLKTKKAHPSNTGKFLPCYTASHPRRG